MENSQSLCAKWPCFEHRKSKSYVVGFLQTELYKGALILKGKGLIHSLFSYADLCLKTITKIPGNIYTWPNSEKRTWPR